jgi:transposase
LSTDGVGTNEIMRRTGKSKTCVWRWQERFMQEGYDGLLRDKTRLSRIPPLGSNITERVVTLTQSDPPAEATHWTRRHDGESGWHQRQFRPTHLACAWPSTAPSETVQALH